MKIEYTLMINVDGQMVRVPAKTNSASTPFIRPKDAKRISIPLPLDFEEASSPNMQSMYIKKESRG